MKRLKKITIIIKVLKVNKKIEKSLVKEVHKKLIVMKELFKVSL